ncbi:MULTISPECIES: phage tail fiber protein [Burkholderia]|uniref:phage tail fiber protein n=1 Tax=Burkholderia TaxID=32008 RepID=UPI00064E2FEC|nr:MULTISPECIES: phage tail fiber protein [Burkholderia]KML20263.1 phage tail fiber protein [Burkholderia cepacia]KML38276.1 phage tail fiber protein [Burkholderia lata]KMN61929.1 phage tail fiber protein [Burkholderia sp. LK4]
MAGNLIYITDAGRAALVAPGNTGTTARQVTQIGLATAAFAFKPEMTAMPSELKRITTFGGDTVAKDTIHIVIQDDSADQYKLFGFGLYLDNGVLFGVYVQNDPILEKAPASMLLLAADTVFASIDVTKLVFGPTSFLNPPATTERQGVVELATQAEVDAGTDDVRAVTPKAAAARYAPLVRPQLNGPVSITSTPTDQDAQLVVAAASGALNRGAKIRFHGTFAAGTADTNARLIASIRAGYDGGTWGREYLDFWINRTPNDSNSDTNQIRAMRVTYGGRVLIGNRNDDGSNALQVAGSGTFSGGITSSGLDAGGANFRLKNGRDVLLRNDGTNFYLLLTDASDAGASWNSLRPLTVDVVTGAVILDGTGAGTYVNGQLAVKGMLNVSNGANEARMLLGPSGGYFFGTANAAGFYLPSTGAMFAFDFAKKNLIVVGNEVWNTGNLPKPAQTTGFTMSGQLLAAEGSVDKPGISFANDGAPDTGFFHISDGVFAITNNGRETMRFLAGGASNRVLIGTTIDDGNALQIGGNAVTRGLHRFGSGSVTTWSNSDAAWGFFRSNGHVSIGSEMATGVLQLIAGNSEIARLIPGGRMTIGGTTDDGANTAQVAGSMRAGNYFINDQGTGSSGLIGMYKGANGPNIGFYGRDTIGAGAMTFSAGGTERARVTANGKFVVGQTGDDGSSAVIQAVGPIKASNGVGALVASNGSGTGQTSIILRREGGATDQRQWELLHDGAGGFGIRTVNDNYSASQNALSISRGSGHAVGNMFLMQNGGRVLIGSAADDGSILNAEGLIRGRGYAVDGGPSWATMYFKNGNTTRFTLGKSDTDDFALSAFENDGSTQRRVLDIPRLTQQVNFVKRPTWAGATPWDSMNVTPLDKNVGGTMAAPLYLQSRGGTNGFEDGTGDNASYSTYNFALKGWFGMGMRAFDGTVNGYYDFRAGKWDVKGGFYVNGARVWDQGTFDPNAKVNKAGDTMTGDLRVKQPNNTDARGFVAARADGTAQAWFHATMNGNYSAWATMKPDGSWQSNAIVVYNADNRVQFNTDIHVTALSRFYNRPTLNRDGWQADIGLRNNRPGYDSWTYLRARDGGGMEIINSAYNAVTWSVDDWGSMYMRGQQILNTDGNLKLAFRGDVWLSDQLANIDNAIGSKANAGARVQWDSGVNNFGTVDRLGGALPAPWVVCGLSAPGNGTANAIVVYGVLLRNQ